MFFNSITYFLFLSVLFLLYWFLLKTDFKKQNLLLLIASYFFYSCWDYRFLFLLIFSTLLDYYTGIKIAEAVQKKNKRFWLFLSIGINVGFLAIFKYYDFFAQSFADAMSGIGIQTDFVTLNVILPVGISFYTFHGISYIIDLYNEKIAPERNFISYCLFVSFFPLLVAGPIERATHLLPQITKARTFSYSQAMNGMRQIIWGLFKKVVVADNCAQYVDAVFPAYTEASALQLITAVVLFSFQIYGDFSGYSDIALGSAKLFGFDLLRNFSFPYFSRDIAEFWRRWHISLTSWFRDYIYIPLGGSKKGIGYSIRNTLIIFIISGFWHGANWTFICWGLLHAVYFMPLLLSGKNRNHLEIVSLHRVLPGFKELVQILFTFSLVSFAWIFFRSASVTDALGFITSIFKNEGALSQLTATYSYIAIVLMLLFEWHSRRNIIPFVSIQNRFIRLSSYAVVTILIFFMGAFVNQRSFIYFQF